MKNKRIIFFLCLFAFAYNIMKAGQKDTAAYINRFKVALNPALMFGQKEYGGLFEYYIKGKVSVEFGGGANVNYTYSWETSHLKKTLVAGEGFTIRTGMRFYSNSRFYFNPIFFYRRMMYHNRYYEWGYRYSGQYEPGVMSYNCGCDGDSGYGSVIGEVLDENKQVFSFEALVGKEFRTGNFVIDIYGGLGVRRKYKEKEIFYDNSYMKDGGGYQFDHANYYSPSKKEKISAAVPTIHAGIQIGFLSKAKR